MEEKREETMETPRMNKAPDVCVIGGGVIGVCSAYYLTRQGAKVLLVEKDEVASGCSGANAGLIVPSHCLPLSSSQTLLQTLQWMLKPQSPLSVKPRLDPSLLCWLWRFRRASRPEPMNRAIRALHDLNEASSRLYDELLSEEAISCDYKTAGWLLVYKKESAFLKAVQEAHLVQPYGMRLQILNPEQVQEKEPRLRAPLTGGIFFPWDARLNPAVFVRALAERLEEKGTPISPQTEVRGFEVSSGRIISVDTSRGKIRPRDVVLAAGAWTQRILQRLGSKLPIEPAKGYSLSLRKPKPCARIPLYLSEAKVAVTPFKDSLRFAGRLEFSGFDFRINPRSISTILNSVKDYLKGMERIEVEKISVGLRPCTPDDLPIIGRLDSVKNLIIVTGHGMMGMTQAPATGRLVSQIICGQPPEIDLRPFAARRFR